ncbi:MAG TPA: co-chaperone GroES [Nitrospirota bacterium]|jgi:chaperonin GroES
MAKKTGASVSFKPLGDRVFVKFMEEMTKTAGGLYIPDAAKEKPQKGIIEAVGKDVEEIKVGDIVLFDKYAGSKINIDNVDYLIVKEDEVLGILS